jgi:hypothetical protein
MDGQVLLFASRSLFWLSDNNCRSLISFPAKGTKSRNLPGGPGTAALARGTSHRGPTTVDSAIGMLAGHPRVKLSKMAVQMRASHGFVLFPFFPSSWHSLVFPARPPLSLGKQLYRSLQLWPFSPVFILRQSYLLLSSFHGNAKSYGHYEQALLCEHLQDLNFFS